jgi:glycosyltransferase involved in cell wall biosynthesis
MNHANLPDALLRKFADRPDVLDAHAAQRARRASWATHAAQATGALRSANETIPADAMVIRSQQLAAWTGYGQLTIAFAQEIEKSGRSVRFYPDSVAEHFIPLPDWCQSRRCGRIPPHQAAFAVGTPFWAMGWRGVQLTMWETTELPADYVANLNDRAGLIVPSAAVRSSFQASGVTVPIEIVPLGIDPATFYPAPLPTGPFTIISGGRVSHGGVRKGHGYLAECFRRAFPGRDDVRLILKVWPDCPGEPAWDVPEDPRIRIDDRVLTDDEIAEFYRSGHVWATGSKGEGWGLMTHQAAASGRAVIGCAFGSAGEIIDHATGWPVPYRLEPAALGSPYRGVGQWACPDQAGMVGALRAAESDRADLARRSGAAARRAALLSWSHATEALIAALTRLGVLTPRPTISAVRAIKARQRLCPHAATTACACECKWLGRRVHVWDDCRRCDHLPTEEESHGTRPRMETEARGP